MSLLPLMTFLVNERYQRHVVMWRRRLLLFLHKTHKDLSDFILKHSFYVLSQLGLHPKVTKKVILLVLPSVWLSLPASCSLRFNMFCLPASPAVAPDTINNHVKTCYEEQKNLHFYAPEYGGRLVLHRSCVCDVIWSHLTSRCTWL